MVREVLLRKSSGWLVVAFLICALVASSGVTSLKAASPSFNDSDWVIYRVDFDLTETSTGNRLKFTADVKLNLHGFPATSLNFSDIEVINLNIESLPPNVTEYDIGLNIPSFMALTEFYMEPESLPASGTIEMDEGNAHLVATYDKTSGILKSFTLNMEGGYQGQVKVSMIDTSVSSLKNDVVPGTAVGGFNPILILAAIIAAIIVVVIAVIVVIKRRKASSVTYTAGYVPAPPPPPSG